MAYFPELLNDERLSGVHGVNRALAPKRRVSLIDRSDLGLAESVVSKHCQSWGGFCDLLIPCRRTSRVPPAPWMRLVDELEIQTVEGGDVLSGKQLDRPSWFLYDNYGIGESLLPILVSTGSNDPSGRVVRVPSLDRADPWYVAYLGILGSWPRRFDQRLLQSLSYRQDLTWDDVIPTTFEDVQGSAADLLERLRDPKSLPPVGASSLYLHRASARRNLGIGGGLQLLNQPASNLSLVGPNLVVVYEPGSVSDLSLLWALRALHGLPPGFPLAIPRTEDVGSILDYWVAEYAPEHFGMGGDRRFCLVSTSLKKDALQAYVSDRSHHWRVGDYREYLQPPRMPARVSVDLVAFSDGIGNVATWGPSDRDELDQIRSIRRPQLLSTVSLRSRPLPPVKSLRPKYEFLSGPRGDGVQMEAGEPNTIKAFSWPVGWDVLEAAVKDQNLLAKPSPAGLAGAALYEALGSLWEVRGLVSMPVLELLNRLAERRGMSWFRDRARQLTNEVAATDSENDRLVVIERKIDQLSLRQFEGEERGITLDQVRKVLLGDREAARHWVKWAEARQLIIRGVEVSCPKCHQVSWRGLGEAAPPIYCRGCNESITEPYREDGLVFRYRAGERLLQAVEHDAIVHILAMHWWAELWSGGVSQRAGVFGAYPGVDLLDPHSGESIGEADVMLVFADGSLGIGECKRHGVGFNEAERIKLDRLAERLNARLKFVATTSWAMDCPEIWPESLAPAPTDPPRYVLSAEHLFELFPRAENLMTWPEQSRDDHDKHHQEFVKHLPDHLQSSRGLS